MWLRICEKEGLNGREPVTNYTYGNYEYRAGCIKAYDWPKPLVDLTAPDVVAFRSWLLGGEVSRAVASKVLSSFHSVMKEMTIRGLLAHNPAVGISVRADSLYQEPVSIPTKQEIIAAGRVQPPSTDNIMERFREDAKLGGTPPGASQHRDMIWIPGGTFRMGSDKHYPEETPGHGR
jgi:hypothetical protein